MRGFYFYRQFEKGHYIVVIQNVIDFVCETMTGLDKPRAIS